MSRFPIQAFIRRMMNRAPHRCAMASMGGVGSTALARHIGSIVDKSTREHGYSPKLFENEKNLRLGYIYGNPYNAVLSIFRRNFQNMHVHAMHADSGTLPVDLRDVSLEAYLEKGIDEFAMERQFDNWVNYSASKGPIILIKYESLAEHVDEVLSFFYCPYPFEVKQRRTSWMSEPSHIRDGLERIYGGLNTKIDEMPPIKILNPFE